MSDRRVHSHRRSIVNSLNATFYRLLTNKSDPVEHDEAHASQEDERKKRKKQRMYLSASRKLI